MYRSIFTGLCALGLFATQASAQRYSIRKPPAILDEVSVGATLLSPCDVSFNNLGNILNSYNTQGVYNDAYIAPDSTAGTSAADGKTYNFSFNSLLQLSDANGNPSFAGEYLKATAIKAEAKGGQFSETGDSGLMQGMDVAFTHYFSRKHTFGLVAGISTNGFSLKRSAAWDVIVTTRSDLYKGDGLSGMDGFSGGNATRPRVFSDNEPEVFVYYENPISLGETVLTDDVKAKGVWDLKAAYVNLRFGATYNLMMTRHLMMRMSGGLALVSASSRFRWDEEYTAPVTTLKSTNNPIISADVNYKHKFLIGGWADIGAHYRVNRVMTVFSSIQYQATDSLDQITKAGHEIKLDSSSIYSMKTGFSWAF